MTSLNESVARNLKVSVELRGGMLSPNAYTTYSNLNEWVEGYIKELQQFLEEGEGAWPPNSERMDAYLDASERTLKFLRGQTK